MSINYVRAYYKVPAKVGYPVTYNGRPGVITSGDSRIRVRFDGEKRSSIIHPTDEGLIYYDRDGNQLWPEESRDE